MIVSASYRTDIPAFYGDWFAARRAAGSCTVKNPYGGAPYRVALRGPAVDGFVFWTRNARPFLPVLDALADEDVPFVVQYTVTDYPASLETGVPAATQAVACAREVAARRRDIGRRLRHRRLEEGRVDLGDTLTFLHHRVEVGVERLDATGDLAPHLDGDHR